MPDERAARPGAGRRPGNPQTRAALIDAARSRFVAHGYDGVTVRSIAADAGVDPALINYFFGGKQGLFAETMSLTVSPAEVAGEVLAGPQAGLGERLLTGVLTTWDDPASGPPLIALVRAAAGEESFADMLREYARSEIIDPIRQRLGDTHPERAAAVGTQILGLVYSRYILRLEPIASAPAAHLVATLAPALQAVIDARGE